MPNTTAWDKVPVHAWYYKAPGVPSTGVVDFKLSGAPNGVKRLDGTAIYRSGAQISVRIGDPAQQDATALAVLKDAYKARAQAAATAAGQTFNATTWDAQWAAALPAMICTGFYANNDPDITPQGWQVMVTERLADGEGTTGPYPIPLTMSMIDATPIPGLNLASIELPPGTPTTPAPTYAKGQPGGVAALDADGDVIDADGIKVIPGAASWTALTGKPSTFPPSTHTHTASQISDSTTVGRALMTAVDAAAARAAIGAGTGSGASSVASTDITDATTVGRGVLTAASAAAARTIIGAGTSSLALGTTAGTAKSGDYVPAWTEITGKPTTFTPATHTHPATDITGLTKTSVGLGNVDNTSDVNKPISTATQAALDLKANTEDIPTALSSLDGTVTIGQVAPRTVVAAYWNGTAWTSSPASSRLDITVMWIDPIGTSTTPPFVAGRIDTYIKATA